MRTVLLLSALVLTTACRRGILADTADPGPDTGFVDADGDGFSEDEDCDDANAYVFPGAPEFCNGGDDDCDGDIDEEAVDAITVYTDADRDGAGDPATATTVCALFDGVVTEAGDCDDRDDDVHPAAEERCNGEDDDCDGDVDEDPIDGDTFYADADGDGYGDAGRPIRACVPPDDAVDDDTDCDDTRGGVHPGADETCNGRDDDCDGDVDDNPVDPLTWYVDIDRDGYGSDTLTASACSPPDGFVANDQDCVDSDAAAFPGAPETCNDRDDDCDGDVDEDPTDPSIFYVDDDGDGYGAAALTACTLPEGATEASGDCDDTRDGVHPGADETCNGRDDDCDQQVDEEATDAEIWFRDRDDDGYGDVTTTVEACEAPTGYVHRARDCDDTADSVHPGADETCNGRDDDCDGGIDETPVDPTTFWVDADGDGFGNPAVSLAVCDRPDGFADNDDDCDDARASVHPGADETCNGRDDDCDGTVDEDPTDPATFYLDTDRDGYGGATTATGCTAPDGFVDNGADCDDARASVHPGADETCNGRDDDCDDTIDEDPIDGFTAWQDADRDGYGAAGTGRPVCALSDGLADNDADCDDTDASRWLGNDADCALSSCTEAPAAGLYWVLDGLGGAFEGWCTDDGWLRIAHLAAGSRSSASIDRTTRFLHHPWIQGTTDYQTLTRNADVVLDGSNYGMIDARGLLETAGAIRWTCTDRTRGHSAEGEWLLDDARRAHLIDALKYDAVAEPVAFVYDGVASDAEVFLTLSHEGYWGSWHICGSGNDDQAVSPDGWQLGFCATPPGQPDSNLRDIPQIAIGYHPGFTGIRLECGNDTPRNSSHIDGELAIWLR